MRRSSVNETNDLCIKTRNLLTYDNCAMKPMNRNGKQEMKPMRGSAVWIDVKNAWIDLQWKRLCCSLHGNEKNCFSFWWLVMDCTPIPNREMAVSLYNLFAGAPRDYIYPPIKLKQLKANHHKLVLSMLMKTTKLPNCEFELHVKINKLKVLERNANTLQHWGDLLLSGWALTWEL